MVKVLLVVDQLMNGRNGVQSFLLTMISQLHKDIKFYLACPEKESPFYPVLKEQGVEILYLNSVATVGPVQFVKELRTLIKLHGPFDTIHGHNDFSCGLVTLAGFLEHVPIRISHSHRGDSEPLKSKLQMFKRSVWQYGMKQLMKKFGNTHVACSTVAGEYFYGKNTRFTVVNNGINLKRFGIVEPSKIEDMRRKLGISEKDFVVGNIAKFSKQKNHDKVIGVFQEILEQKPDSVLILVSTGYEMERIKHLVKVMGMDNRVKFLGDRDDVPLLLQIFDIFLLPSLFEGLPFVLVEAQACGTPCVVSDVIADEVDMGLNLIKFTPLEYSNKEWAEIVMNSNGKNKDARIMHQVIRHKGYSIEDSAQVLLDIYTSTDKTKRKVKYAT